MNNPERSEEQKIFESWEAIARHSDIHRGDNNKVSQAK